MKFSLYLKTPKEVKNQYHSNTLLRAEQVCVNEIINLPKIIKLITKEHYNFELAYFKERIRL